jgi:hypothetical protein
VSRGARLVAWLRRLRDLMRRGRLLHGLRLGRTRHAGRHPDLITVLPRRVALALRRPLAACSHRPAPFALLAVALAFLWSAFALRAWSIAARHGGAG